jgi:hypothetical protein
MVVGCNAPQILRMATLTSVIVVIEHDHAVFNNNESPRYILRDPGNRQMIGVVNKPICGEKLNLGTCIL